MKLSPDTRRLLKEVREHQADVIFDERRGVLTIRDAAGKLPRITLHGSTKTGNRGYQNSRALLRRSGYLP